MKRTFLGLIGAGCALLLLSQILPLYDTHVSILQSPVESRSVGADDAYGVVPLALLAGLLGWLVLRGGARWLLLLIGLLALAALGIGLGRDLVDARASGLRLVAGHYVSARNTVSIGLYVELAGALLLLGAMLVGLLFGEPLFGPAPPRQPARARAPLRLPLRRVR